MKCHIYQEAARRTAKPLLQKQAFDHFVMGIISDWGEVVTAIKAIQVYNKPIDAVWDKTRPEKGTTRDYIKAELGDCSWFVSNGCDIVGIQLTDVVQGYVKDTAFQPYLHLKDGPEYWARQGCVAASWLAAMAVPGVEPQSVKVWLMHFFVCVTQIMREYGLTLDEVFEFNIDKLRKRYPDAYSDEAAQARADTV